MPDAKRWWDSHYAEFVKDLRLLLEVPSVSEPNDNARQPYGSACAQVLERMAAIAIRFGFAVTIQDYQYLLADWGDRPDSCIGIFSHLDVVPAGEGWSYPPFGLTELGEVLIGRGASDNKGPALACLYAAAYLLQERGFSPRHSLRLFYGVNEEKSMQDIQHFLAHQPMPRFSLVPDAAFPVCHGEKGIMGITAIRRIPPSSRILSWHSGIMANAVPATASALVSYPLHSFPCHKADGVLAKDAGGGLTQIEATGISAHAAFPEGSQSAQNLLCSFLLQNEHLDSADRAWCTSILALFSDYYGNGLGVPYEDEVSGRLTHVGGFSRFDRKVSDVFVQDINIRYCITADVSLMKKEIERTLQAQGFTIDACSDSKPSLVDKDSLVVKALTRIANEVTGLSLEPYVMGGGTYARKLRNAVGFGLGIPHAKALFGQEKGHGHQADEYVWVEHLEKGFMAYVKAIAVVDLLV